MEMSGWEGGGGAPLPPGEGAVTGGVSTLSWAAEGEQARFVVSVRDDWKLWPQLEPHVGRFCFPIRDYTWIQDSEFRTTIPVACLDVHCLADSSPFIDPDAPPGRWWRRPFLHLFLVKCEDASAYKEGVRDRMRAWVADRTAAGDEYLVLYLPLGSAKSSSTYLYLTSPSALTGEGAAGKIYRKLFEKMRSDVKQAERVVLFDLSLHAEAGASPDSQPPARHAGEVPYDAKVQAASLCSRLRETLLCSIAARMTEYEERIARAHGARQAEGWDFSAAFLPRDAIALMYRSMGAIDPALRQYRAWGEYFDEFVTGQTASHFPHFEPRALPEGAHLTDPLDPSSTRPYLELASKGLLSEVEFRLFVLGREVRLLADAKRLAHAAHAALANIKELASEAAARQDSQGITPLFPVSISVSCAEWCACDLHKRIDGLSHLQADRAEDAEASYVKNSAITSEVKIAHCAVAELYMMAARSASALIMASPQLQQAHRRSKSTGSSSSSVVATPIGEAPATRAGGGSTTASSAQWGGAHEHEVEDGASRQQAGTAKRDRNRSSGSWLPAKVSSLLSGPGNAGMSRALSTIRRPTWAGWEKDAITQSVRGAYNRGMASFPFNDSPDSQPSSSSLAAPSSSTSSALPLETSDFPSTPMTPSPNLPTLLFRLGSDPWTDFTLPPAQEISALEQVQSGPLADAIACGGIEDYWLRLTSTAKDHLLAGGRTRCANYLVVEMAEAHVQRQRWGEAGELLRYAFEQLITDAWNPLIEKVYEPLCQCLEVLGEDAARLALALALLSCPCAPAPLRSSAAEMLRDLPSQMAGDGLVHEMGGLVSVSLQLPRPPPVPLLARQASVATNVDSAGKEGEDKVEIDLGDGIVLTSTRVLFEDSNSAEDHADGASRRAAQDPASPSREGWESRRHVVPVGCDLVIECKLENRLPCDLKVDALALALLPDSEYGVASSSNGSKAAEARAGEGQELTNLKGGQDQDGDGQNNVTGEKDSVLRAVLEAAGVGQEHTGMLLLEKKDFVMKPGRNSITLTTQMRDSGRFLLTALTLRSGKLILAHSLRRDSGVCIVEGRRGIPSAKLTLSTVKIVQGVPSLVRIVLLAGEGGTTETELRLLGRSDGVQVFSKCCVCDASRTTAGPEQQGEDAACLETGNGGWVRLPDMQPGTAKTVMFAVLAESATCCNLEMCAELRYRGAQGALFTVDGHAQVFVSPAFTVDSHMIQTVSGVLLKLILRCVPSYHRFQLRDVRVTCQGEALTEVFSEAQGEVISESVIAENTVHCAFHIPRVETTSNQAAPEFEVSTQYSSSWTDPLLSQMAGALTRDLTRVSTVRFVVDKLGTQRVRIRIRTPPTAVLGSPVSASMCLVDPVHDQQGRPLQFRFCEDSALDWLVVGLAVGVLDPSIEDVPFTLIPLRSGVLTPPAVELVGSGLPVALERGEVIVVSDCLVTGSVSVGKGRAGGLGGPTVYAGKVTGGNREGD